MTHFAMTPFARLSPTVAIGHAIARVWRVFKNRRQIVKLYELSDSQLEDIGLTRGDVRRALQLPLFSDPTPVLSGWADEKRVTFRPIVQDRLPIADGHPSDASEATVIKLQERKPKLAA
ncbi:DUF1127 domain-containing protein [Roseibium aggregatum]|uniref:DUF1127 domain-containing protein n=1 Tax=Roseibium aggregatum TaxID=187304 RepID=A0A926S566_9HYPH|nr:DUF1127 domain-containing protein [Roseibium aggregatum]MBD1546156.1 DUF1127 domain-containing protein [Roseibium aggregatum]